MSDNKKQTKTRRAEVGVAHVTGPHPQFARHWPDTRSEDTESTGYNVCVFFFFFFCLRAAKHP